MEVMIMNVETIEKLKRLANNCVFSMEGITIIKTEEYNYRLKQIDQLTNNWNELEEWLKSYIALIENPDTLEEQTLEDLKEVLDKMKEIKERNNV